MAATVNSPGTVSLGTSPAETTSVIDTLLATPLEQWTVSQVRVAFDAMSRVVGGSKPSLTIGQVLGASSTDATVTGSKTVHGTYSPSLTSTVLTNLLAVAPQNLTQSQLGQIVDALKRVSGGGNPNATVGGLLQ
jgi:hypothetical protein